MNPALELRRLTAEQARQARDQVQSVFERSYIEAIESGDPFDSPGMFMGRFDAYTANPLFDLVVAYQGGKPVGQTWGWRLTAHSRWWEGLVSEPEPGFTDEDGTRTFALSEIMVVREFTGRGIAHALHDQLLRARHEKRATLLAEPDNTSAYRAYLKWGWRKVSQIRPHWQGAPTYDVLMMPLPLR
jgi:ribosomal protein S18 acetylase RimI-like enzyme